MSCSDSKKSKKRKSSKSGNMGDVLGKECGDGEKDEMPQETCGEDVREEADGAPSGDEQSSQSSGDPDNYEIKRSDEIKEDILSPEEAVTVLSAAALATAASQREEKPCTCEACKDRREHAAEQLEEMRRLQSYWMELRQYIRMVYRMVMEGHSIENDGQGECDPRMKDLVQKLCARDPHQLFQRLEAQVQEFVIEAKVRQLELVREQQIPELAQIFLTGLLDGYEKLCAAAKQLTPLLQPLEIHHLQRFNISWEVLNKHLYQSCVYTDHSVQNNLPLYIGQLRNMLPGKNEAYSELVHRYLAFDDEMTLIGAMWRDAETLIDAYNNEEATRKAKQRMLREDLELFKVQRKLIQQQQQQQPKHGREQRDYGDPLPALTNLGGPTSGPGPGSLRDSPEDEAGNNGYCPGCSTRRGCPCDDCAVTHILTCGVTPPDSPLPLYSHRLDLQQEYRVEAEGSEQPLESPSEPDLISADGAVSGDVEGTEIAPSQQQSCECHVCTAPLMTPMDLMESYECHSCVQQGVPIPGSTPAVNLNLHAGGFHLYPHIHGTGGGGDASSLYPHIYNYQSLLTQLGPKHSRMGVHIQEQLQLTTSPAETKTSHLLQSQLVPPSPSASSVSELLPPGMTLEPLPASTSPPHMTVAATSTSGAAGFSTPPPAIPEGSPQSLPVVTSVPQTRKQPSPTSTAVGSVANDSVPAAGAVKQQVVPTSCREHTKPPMQSLQSSASTQTSPNKAKSQQQQKSSVVTGATITRTQLSQSVVKRGPATTQHPAPASSPPATATRTVPSNGNSVRHSTTQTANHSHASSHQPLPDVVKSAATSTTPTQHRTAPASSKVPAHSCHKNLKNVGSIEPIKRVACTDYPDSEAADLEDSSSQDDTCSERSSSTTTSTQRDSRHCDCCYCEVFGHGMPSVAPVSRNYQEMRERLRLLLTKKKAKCKIGGVAPSSVGNGAPVQPPNAAPPTTPEAAGKPSGGPSGVPAAPPLPAASGSTVPVLAKQDSVDSLPQSNVKDPRDLEALLDFIEGNQSARCKDAKKAAKKARQKQKKLEEKERKDQEEAERLRLEELQNKTPEVTITVVNTPQQQQQPQGKGGKKKSGGDSKNKAEKSSSAPAVPSQQPSPAAVPVTSTQSSSPPQMVTIKRVMESNGAEPTVTITLKGATPDKDKVLFTLVNGQGDYLCQAQENVKATSQQQPPSGNQNNSSKNGNVNSKKKNKKGNSGNAPRNPSSASGGKTVHSTAKNGSVMKTSNAANGASGNNSKQNCNNNGANKSGAAQQKQRPSSAVVLNDSVSEISPLARTPYLKQLSSSASVQINNVINNISSGKSGSVGTAQKLKSESNNVGGNRSFSLENLKLPPGITITKVDGPSSTTLRKTQTKPPAENPKPSSPMMPNHSSTTIIAAPMVGGGPNKTVGYSTSVSQTLSGSNVIVVDTGKMKEVDTAVTNGDDAAHSSSSSKKKNKKKNKNSDSSGNANKVRQQQVTNGVTVSVKHPSGVQANKGMNPPQQQNGGVNIKVPQSPVHPLLSKHSIRPQALNTQPAIIKVNGAMVTIRNPALQQAMASASGSRFPAAQRPEVMVNGEAKQPSSNKSGKKSGAPPASGAKGKENSSTVPPRFANAESNAAAAAAMLRNRLASDCNGLNGLHISKVNNSPPDGIALRGSANGLPPRMMRPQQQQQKVGVMQNGPSHPQENSMAPSHSSMARTMMQNQTAMREAMAAANEAKKKKKKKKGAGGQGHADDWNLVESVFAPKDIDLENGDIDDDERELEAFKRFCFNSVPPKRKEKVHLNIKDIVLKKKSSAIGCS